MQTFQIPGETPLTRTQRMANLVVVIAAVAGIAFGFLLKNQVVTGTTPFRDLAAGILARVPANWLLDTTGDYVLSVRDPASPGFRTTLQVAVESIGNDASARNILDNLTLQRAQVLAAYDTLGTVPFTLPDGEQAIRLDYVYVDTEQNPFLARIPSVVHGVDIVAIKRGQAVIVTFRVEADRFEDEVWRLEQFLASLEF